MFNILQKSLGTNTKAIEMLCVIEGIKPVARFAVGEGETERLSQLCTTCGLFVCFSTKKVIHEHAGGYASKALLVSLEHPAEGLLWAYIAQKKELALEAKIADEEQDHKRLGELLGYPTCCVAFFAEHNAQEQEELYDFVRPAFASTQSKKLLWHSNIFGRYVDLPVVSHCPCSFDCQATHEQAKTALALINVKAPLVYEQMQQTLKKVVVYSGKEGVFFLDEEAGESTNSSLVIDYRLD